MTAWAPVLLLIGVLAFAVVRPRGLPEVVAAAPAAVLVIALGLVSWPDARGELVTLGPTVGFLAAVLVLARSADDDGVFGFAGAVTAPPGSCSTTRPAACCWSGRTSRRAWPPCPHHRPHRPTAGHPARTGHLDRH